jgi:lysylphosphatidylglycerol synthetase-like protein (DUF2156 family)
MKPCRDCSQPAPASAHSCPHCGILNPVVQWVAMPDGSHHTARVAPDPVAAAAALSGALARPGRMPAPAAPRPLARSAAAAPAPVPASGPEVDAIRTCSNIFFALAALNAVAGLFLGTVAYVEAGIMAVLSLVLRRYNSRAAAVLLVLYAVLTVLTKVQLMLASGGMRLGWIWMWVLVAGAAFKAAAATFKLRQVSPALA